ncbi:MAG: YihY/virulence factor BrkB family protein [Pacificimonas sp.]|jgi:membrane protein|nr:YihY/virulence factor BrkB family protein [Pacificimonas sp.]
MSQAELTTDLSAAWSLADRHHVGIIAAGVAFYGFLAFVPMLAAIVLAYGLVADPAMVESHIDSLGAVLPNAAADLIAEQLRAVSEADQGRTGFGLVLALLGALWGATKGAKAVMTALNIIYDVNETRGFVSKQLAALGITAVLVAVLIGAALTMTVSGYLETLLPSLGPVITDGLKLLTWLVLAAIVVGAIVWIYRVAPHRETGRSEQLRPGAVTAAALWLVATVAFGFYAARFGSYNATYGSLGAVVVFVLWLYLSAYAVMFGASLNRVRNRREPRGET